MTSEVANSSWTQMVMGTSSEGARGVMKRRISSTPPSANRCKEIIMLRSIGSVTFLALLMVGCGGGGSLATYSIGGTVSGIDAGQSAILRDNGGDDLTVSANGAFAFVTRIASGGVYAVTVTAPEGKTCTVTGGSGTVSATVTNVAVACVGNASSSIGGTAFVGDFFFVANSAADSISEFSTDATSGALLSVGQPVAADRGPTAIASTIADTYFVNRYLYVSNSRSSDVSAFVVDAGSGALTAVPGSPFAAGTSPRAIAVFADTVCSSRGFPCHIPEALYVANSGSDTVSAYQIDQSTGVLTPLASYATGTGPSAMAVGGYVGPSAPGNPFLYIANTGGSNDISAFLIDGLSGSLTPVAGSPFPSNGNVSSLAFGLGDTSGGTQGIKGLLYAANASGGTASIMGFSIHLDMGDANAGALTALPGFPYDLPSCSYIVADQTGAYLYATAGTNVFSFIIDQQTGALSPLPGSPVAVGTTADSVSIDPTNRFLYVTSRSAGKVTGFNLDAATGELTIMPGSPFAVSQ
jgi:6-phosphogluconolactonase